MLSLAKTIHIEPGGEIDRLLDEAKEGPITIEREGVRYHISRILADHEDDEEFEYDPERARAGMRAAAGFLTDEDAERLRNYIYEGREQGTRP